MNESEIRTRFPNASQAFVRANLSPCDAGEITELESGACVPPLGAKEVQGFTGQRFLVRVTSIRRRLLDTDNSCEKFHVDLLRYAGVIPDDTPDKIEIEVRQIKAGKGREEETVIEVFEI